MPVFLRTHYGAFRRSNPYPACILALLKGAFWMSAAVTRFALLILAIVLIVVGLIVLPLPIPFGAIMIVTGLGILISTSETAADWVRRRRMKSPRVDGWLASAERRLPGKLGEILRRTAP
jgi:hypothetical protein